MAFGALKGTALTGNNASIGTSLAATGSVSVAVGDLIFFCLFEQLTSTITSAADNLHGAASYTLFAAVDAGTTTAVCGYRRVTVAGTLTSVTATVNGGTNNGVIDAIVIEGPFVTSPLDVHPTDISNDITTPYLSPASGALAYAPSAVVSWFASTGSATMTVAAPYTKDTEHATAAIGSVRIARQVVNSLASVAAASWTGTAPTDDVLGTASFKAEPLGSSHWPLSNIKAAINKISLAMVAASGLTLVPQPPVDYCVFQNNAFQNDAFQVCADIKYGWHAPLSKAPTAKRPLYQNQAFYLTPTVVADNNVTIDKWQQPLSRAVPVPRAEQPGGQPFVPEEATRENTTNTVWPLAFGEAARPTPSAAQQGTHLFVPAQATIDNTTGTVWPLTQGEKARPLGRPAPQGYHLFIPDEATSRNTTTRVWPLVFGEKARPIEMPAPQGHHLFVPEEATVENTVTIAWPLTFGEKARPLPLPAPQGHHLFVPEAATVENTTNTVWPLTQGEKARPLPLPAPSGMWVFNYVTPPVENTTTIDKWQQPLSRSVPIPRPAPPGLWAFGYPYLGVDNTIGIEKWQQPLSRSVPIPRSAPVGGQPFVPKEATLDNTTNTLWPLVFGEVARPIPRAAQQGSHLFVPDEPTLRNTTIRVWPLTQGEKARPVPRVAPQGMWAFGYPYLSVDNTTGIEKWQQPLSRSVPVPRPAPVGGAPFIPREATVDNTTNTLWPLTFGEKARPIARVAMQGAWVFGYPYVSADNNVTIDKWQQPLADPTKLGRPLRNYLRGGQPFVPREATLENTIRGIPWLQAWKGPPRIRPRNTVPLYVTIVPVVENTVTPDKWLQAWQGPPRYLPRPTQPTFLRRLAITHDQSVACDLELTVDIHVCGWGTVAEAGEAFVEQGEQGDIWSIQAEQTLNLEEAAFQNDAFQNDAFQTELTVVLATGYRYTAQTEEGDAWSEQAESTDEYDEKDECGR